MCPYCRRVWEKDGLDDCRTVYDDNKVNRETTPLTLQEKLSGCDGGIQVSRFVSVFHLNEVALKLLY